MANYDTNYSRRDATCTVISGKDSKGKWHNFENVEVLANVNYDRLTSVTVWNPRPAKGQRTMAARLVSSITLGRSSDIVLDNLLQGNPLSRIESWGL